jgi:hypothetical protein
MPKSQKGYQSPIETAVTGSTDGTRLSAALGIYIDGFPWTLILCAANPRRIIDTSVGLHLEFSESDKTKLFVPGILYSKSLYLTPRRRIGHYDQPLPAGRAQLQLLHRAAAASAAEPRRGIQ